MLFSLTEAPEINGFVYNTPAEVLEAKQLKGLAEKIRGVRVELGSEEAGAGPICDGSRFAENLSLNSENFVIIFWVCT